MCCSCCWREKSEHGERACVREDTGGRRYTQQRKIDREIEREARESKDFSKSGTILARFDKAQWKARALAKLEKESTEKSWR